MASSKDRTPASLHGSRARALSAGGSRINPRPSRPRRAPPKRAHHRLAPRTVRHPEGPVRGERPEADPSLPTPRASVKAFVQCFELSFEIIEEKH